MATIEVRKDKRKEFLSLMKNVKDKLADELACEQFEIYQEMKNSNAFSICGLWATPEDFRRHLRSEEFMMVMVAAKLLRKVPQIQYSNNTTSIGLPELLQMRRSR